MVVWLKGKRRGVLVVFHLHEKALGAGPPHRVLETSVRVRVGKGVSPFRDWDRFNFHFFFFRFFFSPGVCDPPGGFLVLIRLGWPPFSGGVHDWLTDLSLRARSLTVFSTVFSGIGFILALPRPSAAPIIWETCDSAALSLWLLVKDESCARARDCLAPRSFLDTAEGSTVRTLPFGMDRCSGPSLPTLNRLVSVFFLRFAIVSLY